MGVNQPLDLQLRVFSTTIVRKTSTTATEERA
jgi:hypothetical protein